MSMRMISEREGSDQLRDPVVKAGESFELMCRIRVPSVNVKQKQPRSNKLSYEDGDDEDAKWKVYWRTVSRSFWPQNDTEYGDWVQLGRLDVDPHSFTSVPKIRRQFRDRMETSGWIGRGDNGSSVLVLARLAVRNAQFNDTGLYRCVLELDGQKVYTDYLAEQQSMHSFKSIQYEYFNSKYQLSYSNRSLL